MHRLWYTKNLNFQNISSHVLQIYEVQNSILIKLTMNSANRKTSIYKMSSSYLSSLADQPNITLDKLRKMKQINGLKVRSCRKSYISKMSLNGKKSSMMQISQSDDFSEQAEHPEDEKMNFVAPGMIDDLTNSGVSDTASIIKNTSLLKSFPMEHVEKQLEDDGGIYSNESSSEQREKLKEKKHPAEVHEQKTKMKDLQMQLQKESLVRTLHAYLRVCIECGMLGRAYHTIIHYRKKNVSTVKSSVIRDVKLYNVVLQAYAAHGNLSKIREFVRIIEEDKLKMNVKTYSAIFECFGNLSDPKKEMNFLSNIQLKMLSENITLNDIINNSKFKARQYETVLKGISLLNPLFVPQRKTVNEKYNCHLLENLTPNQEIPDLSSESKQALEALQDEFKKQFKNEMRGYVDIKSIEKFNLTPTTFRYKEEVKKLESRWRDVITVAFERDLKALKNREHKPIPNALVLYPCLSVLNKDDYVDAIMNEIRHLANGSETYSPSLSTLCKRLGKHINDKFDLQQKKKMGYVEIIEKIYTKYYDWYVSRTDNTNCRTIWTRLSEELSKDLSLESESTSWPVNLQNSVGKFLYDIILKDIKIDVNCIKKDRTTKRMLPAFYTIFRTHNGKLLIEEIKPHPTLVKLYRDSKPENLTFETLLVPSVCPPRPWTSFRTGGYWLLKTDLVRLPLYVHEQLKRLENTNTRQLWPSFDCLNQLGLVPWTVNNSILDLVVEIFRDGGSVKLNIPQPPSALQQIPLIRADSSKKSIKNVIKARLELKRKQNEMYSLWCDALYRLSLANHFRNKIFWLPHNMDFRGRVYPVPPHLNHLGSDLARAMLIFALGKPLGPKGLDWLKIHTINLTGLKKKEPIAERLRYANEILDDIIDSAENPLTGKMWWASSEEPWQTLAACMEVTRALKSPNPEEYICRFPVHQDGSCNGLQHYAALGRDVAGAASVNLAPSDKPQDVYSNVAVMVDELRRRDAANGVEIARILENFVRRKIIKQTVMTTVYGVTRFGARLQIARQLKDLNDFPIEHVWSGSLYLAQKTFESLQTMFESAKKIQDWLTDCARVVSTIKGQNMEWITPLGLPIVQPYSKVVPLKSIFRDIAVDSFQRPNTSKQKNAFAPNFIHSLDACHMMLTSIYCENTGITFVSVHDCYWTHPCSVEVMNKICREQFVALHSQPILEDLSSYFIDKFIHVDQALVNTDGGLSRTLSERKLYHTLSNVPKKGKFELQKVLESTYFFS